MKRIVSALLVITITGVLVACGGKPTKMDDETYNIGKQALAVEERIRSGSLDAKEGRDQLDELADDLDDVYAELDELERTLNLRVSIAINGFYTASFSMKDTTEEYNKLKQLLGE